MKKTNRIFATLTVLILVLSVMAASAFADTEIAGPNDITFMKFLTMDANANVPDASFSFTIASGTAVPSVTVRAAGSPAVMAGPEGAMLSYGEATAATVSVAFTPDSVTYEAAQTGDSITLAEGEKYAKATVTVDLSAVTFVQPGIYRYNITESGENDGVTNDTAATRYLDIYVISDDLGNLSVDGSVLHNTPEVMGAAGGVYAAKSNSFNNTYTTYDLTISKDITGNQGFRGKYFTFTVAITGADANTRYTVDLGSASTADSDGNANPTQLVADADGAVTGTFYLKDNESIVIQGLTSATMYTVSEAEEDYTPSYVLDAADSVAANSTPANAPMDGADHTVAFTNYRNGIVPTGILLEVAPYAIIVLIAAAAAVLMIIRKRRASIR